MSEAIQEVLLDDELIEKDFNDALTDLQKSLESDSEESLRKAKDDDEPKGKSKDAEDEDESEEEEEEDMDYEKSISEILAEDPNAAAAIDVEPFLRQLTKAMDETIMQLSKSMQAKFNRVEKMVKSQGEVLLMTAKLEKSTADMIRQIGGTPVRSQSVKVLNKSRFEGGKVEYDNMTVLQKSREWVRAGKIDLTEAGMIEGRINKNQLGNRNDRVDQKVEALMKEGN